MRFQVAIPFTRSAFGNYFRRAEDYPILEEAYEEVANRELAEIVEAIPAHDLAIQWDVCCEILDIEDYYPWWPKGDRLEMNSEPAVRLHLERLPEQAWLGYHICYGTSGGWPMKKPEDVVLSVALSNALVQKTLRKVDFVHFPAGRKAFDPAYYAALEDLDIECVSTFAQVMPSEGGCLRYCLRGGSMKVFWAPFQSARKRPEIMLPGHHCRM